MQAENVCFFKKKSEIKKTKILLLDQRHRKQIYLSHSNLMLAPFSGFDDPVHLKPLLGPFYAHLISITCNLMNVRFRTNSVRILSD